MRDTVEHKGDVSQAVLKQKTRAIIYCRVSTEKQEVDGESLDYQEEKCKLYAELHGYDVLIVLKEAKSGFIHYSLREKLTLARQMVRDGFADIIIVFDLRRFSRNFVHSAMIFEEIEQAGGEIISVSENIDNSLTGKLIRSILSWSAESERHKIVEYANRHWQTRLEQGLPVATGRAPYGWGWGDKEKTYYVIVPEEMAIRQSILYMFVELDMSLRSIAHKLTEDHILTPARARGVKCKKTENAWLPSTVCMIIKDKKNIEIIEICKTTQTLTEKGTKRRQPNPNVKTIVNSTLENGTKRLPSAIDINLYERALRKLKTNRVEKSHLHRNPEDFLLKGHIYCEECTYAMRGKYQTTKGHTYPFYCCANNRNKYSGCTTLPAVQSRRIDQIVWEDCCRLFERLDLIQTTIEQALEKAINDMLEDTKGNELVLALQEEIKGAEQEQSKHQKGSYYHRLVSNDIQEKKEQLCRYQEESKNSKFIINQVNAYKKRVYGFIEFINIMKGRYHEATFQKKRDALEVLGVKVHIHANKQKCNETIVEAEKYQQEWLSVREAAQITGLAERTLYTCISSGKLQAAGGGMPHIVVHRDIFNNFLQTTRVKFKNNVCVEQCQQEWLTIKDITKITGKSLESIRKYIVSGKIPAQKAEGGKFIHREELEKFIKTQAVKPKTMHTIGQRIEITYSPILTGVQQSFG